MQDLSTGPFRQLSPPCSLYGRTAGFPWESMEIYISLMCWLMTLLLITAVMLTSPIGMSFSRRCLWLLKCLQVSNLIIIKIICIINVPFVLWICNVLFCSCWNFRLYCTLKLIINVCLLFRKFLLHFNSAFFLFSINKFVASWITSIGF